MVNETAIDRRELLMGGLGTLAATAAPLAASASASAATASPVAPETWTVHARDGTRLIAQASGPVDGPEILFVHGLRQSRLSWDKQVDDPSLAPFRLVRFDLRGHGDSDKPDAPEAYADADRWADDVAAVIEATNLRRPVLVGWSLGGFVVGAYLRKYGGSRIAGINLVDGVTKLSPDLLTAAASEYTRRCTSHDLAERVAATAEFLAECFHRPVPATEFQRMLVVNGMTARAVNEGFVRTTTQDMEPVFAAYAGPVLVTHGAHDRLVRLAMSQRIAALRAGIRLSVFPGSGHSPFYDEPERYGRELAAFTVAANARSGGQASTAAATAESGKSALTAAIVATAVVKKMGDDPPFYPGFERLDVDAGGVRFSGAVGGSGPPLLLLHGYPETHIAWRKVAPILARSHRLVIPDLPGYGGSRVQATTPRWTKRRVPAALVALMRSMGHERFALAGHDRGARAGYRLVLDHPGTVVRFASLAVVPTLDAMAAVDYRQALSAYHWFFLSQPADLPERLLSAAPMT